MRNKKIFALLLCTSLVLSGCNSNNAGNTTDTSGTTNISATAGTSSSNTNSNTETVSALETSQAKDAEDNKIDIVSDFSITTEDGNVSVSTTENGSTYTITSAGTYVLSGKLSEGTVIIYAADSDKVNLELNNVSITSSTTAPIQCISADSLKIKAIEDTYNEIIDTREAKSVDDDTANAAIYATCDLNLTGKGTLNVSSTYNNGIQSKDSISIKNQVLKVTALNNAIKGNESVEIESGDIIVISTGGDGIKTSDSSVSSKGNQHGSIKISGGNIDIYACCDGISAAYNVEIDADCNINIHTDKYSSYTETKYASSDDSATVIATTASNNRNNPWGGFGGGSGNSNKSSYSTKGIKAYNEIIINNGTITIECSDDGIHANNDEVLENGSNGLGNITINGGNIIVTCADDGIHADNELEINGGYINITTSYEGIEGNIITINDGTIFVYATDDGLNAGSGNSTPLITINGGYVDVTTASGDTDGIDSNGNLIINGGLVFVKGGSNMGSVAGSIDVDGSITVTAGNVIALGGICETPESGSVNGYAAKSTTFSSGTYEIKDGSNNVILSFTLSSSFSNGWFSSESFEVGKTYTLYKDGTSLISWTQESGTMNGSAGGFGNFGGFGGQGGPGNFGGQGDQGNFGGQGGRGDKNGFGGQGRPDGTDSSDGTGIPEGVTPPEGFEMPEGATPPEGFEMPEGATPPNGFEMPEGATPPNGFGGFGDQNSTEETTASLNN